MTRVLVVDDEPAMRRTMRIYLASQGYDVDVAPHGTAALEIAAHKHPDAVLLDLGLPDLDGVDVIRGLRGWTSAPILILSARTASADKVRALDAGADDYVTKPFGMDELLARLRAVVRRSTSSTDSDAVVTTASFTVDLSATRVTVRGADVRLTPTEWRILEVLVRNTGRLVSRRQLLTEVRGAAHAHDTNYLRVYLAQLRHKLEPDPTRPRHLITEPGMGYRFEP